jgi:prepilin-type N-terminal cleavage/methylation domain-containing protein
MIINMNRRGFTIVELIIVITIMGILLVLGVANLRSSQAGGRDSERKTDVETIASYLDSYYKTGSDFALVAGSYPSTLLTSSGVEYMEAALSDIDVSSLEAPGITDPTQTFVSATNNVQVTTGVTPQPTINQYVYQPIKSDGTLCTGSDECRKFNIYWRSEADNNVYIVTSKNQ